jgi:UPF0755 protein
VSDSQGGVDPASDEIFDLEKPQDAPAHRRRRGFLARHLVGVIISGVVIVVLVVIGVGWLWYTSAESGTPGTGVVINVASGESFTSIRSDLVKTGVVRSGFALDFYVLVHGTPDVQAGQYYLQKNDSFGDVLGILNDPPNILDLEIPSGFTVSEISGRMESAGYDTLSTDFQTLATSGNVRSPFEPAGQKNLDGLLGAGSYQILPAESAKQVLVAMIDSFTKAAALAGLTPSTTLNGLDAYQVVTLASIVEKEGYIHKNMTKVSRVIYNRLANGMPLQMDSTILYSLGQDGGSVTSADLQIKSPYNTYLNTGLTPTPICFPSTYALDAALHPADGQWLYFVVVDQDGTEAFSDTYSGQLANERLAQQRGLG